MSGLKTLMPEVKKEENLQSAVDKAYDRLAGNEEVDNKLKGKTPPVDVEETEEEEEESEETEETEETQEDDTSDEDEKAEALKVYKLLKDPKSRQTTIEYLMFQAGITAKPAETLKEVTKQKKAVAELVKEALGPEYAFLADKLGKAIELSLEESREESNRKIDAIEQTNLVNEVNRELAKLSKRTNGHSTKLESKMVELMDKYPSSANISVAEYLDGIYIMASKGQTPGKTQVNLDKAKKNANNVSERLGTKGVQGGGTGADKIPDKKMKISDAVNWAMEELQKQK